MTRVLLVDDELPILRALVNLICVYAEHDGRVIEVECVEDGQSALKRLEQTQDNPIHVVLLDLRMRTWDTTVESDAGFVVARAIQADPQRYGTPRLILHTAYGGDPGVAMVAKQVGIQTVVTKPANVRWLTSQILAASPDAALV
jgi:CheY-like chemotaxis protein